MSAAGALASLSSDEWLRFLSAQRWFGAKGAAPRAARVARALDLPWGLGAFAVARVDVDLGGRTRSYQVPVACRDAVQADLPPRAIIRAAAGGTPALYDAVYDAGFRAGLGASILTGAEARDDAGACWRVAPLAPLAPLVQSGVALPPAAALAESAVGSAEQSNTSIVFGDTTILKLFRVLQRGVQPDVEVTAFLTTRARFAYTPSLLATIELDEPGAESATAGMAVQYLPGSIDGWRDALERARPYFAQPAVRDPLNDYASDARQLGAVTRELHEALASADGVPDFAPEPALPDDLERWADRARESVRTGLALLERALADARVPAEHAAEAEALSRRGSHYLGWIDEIADELGDDLGLRIRVHGDYHLGQTLRTTDGRFMIIDFEGEPARPLAERREKTSPLRDVAGMLRSFSYAAATLATTAGASLDLRTRELRSARWERDVRAAYLEGYARSSLDADDAPIVPESREHVRQLLALFETEKVFYELAYELNNRPSWTWIPLRGIAKLFTR